MTEWKDNISSDDLVNRLKEMKEQTEKIISDLKKEKEEIIREYQNGRMAKKKYS